MRYYNTYEQHRVPRRSLYDYGLVVVLKGEIDFSYEGKTVEVHEGEAHIMPPAVNHFEYIKKAIRVRISWCISIRCTAPKRATGG